ncbi:MAG: phosphotriesterase family protein [Pseudomonadota bacterium]
MSAESLGVTMVHEHLLMDLTCVFQEPAGARERRLARVAVGLDNLSWVRRNWNSNLDNLRLDDEARIIEELLQYKLNGGVSLVEVSNIGLARDPLGLQRIARATGVNVVMGSGYYIDIAHPPDMDQKSEHDIEEEIVRDITIGVGGTGVRAGVIGELGCSWPLTANEIKVLRAGARAQRRTGAGLTIHIGRHEDSPLEIMACLKEAGAELSRVIMDHMDRTDHPMKTLVTLADAGCYIEFDTFGQETWVYPFGPTDRLSDAQRVDIILRLVTEGLLEKILVSQDVGYKHRLESYGGSGYSHILTTVLPHQMRRKGMTENQIHTLLVENPARVLQLV